MFSYEKSFEDHVASMNPKPLCLCRPTLATSAEHGSTCPVGYARSMWSAQGRAMWEEIRRLETTATPSVSRKQRDEMERTKLDAAMVRGANASA
jgi:hypothetical protein